jgi:hypothetical protein
MPNSELVNWIAYLQAKEQREQMRMVEALSVVATKLFRKAE